MDSQSFMEVSYHSSDFIDTEEDGEMIFEEVEEGEISDDSSSYKSSGDEEEEEDDEEEEEKQEEQPNDVGNASAPVKAKAPIPLHQLLANKLKNTPVKLSNNRSSGVRSVKDMAAAFHTPRPSFIRPDLKTGSFAATRKFPSENSPEQQPNIRFAPQRAPDKASPSVETPKLSPLKSTQPPQQQHQQQPEKKPVDKPGPNKMSPSAEIPTSSSRLNSPQQQSKTKLRQGGDPNTSQTRGKGIDSKGNKSPPKKMTKRKAEVQSEMETSSEASSACSSEWTASSGPSSAALSQTNPSPEFKNVGDPSQKVKNSNPNPNPKKLGSSKRTLDHSSYDESSFGFSLSSGTDESLAAKIGDLGTPFASYPISDDHNGYDGTMSLQSTSNSRRKNGRASEGMQFDRQVSWNDFGEGRKHGRKSITDNSDSMNDDDDESTSYESYETASSEEFETDTEEQHSKSLSPPGLKSSDIEEESAVSSDYETDSTYERIHAATEGRTPPAPRRVSKAFPLPSGPSMPNLGMQMLEESENGESSGTSNSFRQSQNSGLDTSTGAISGKKSNESDIYDSGTPVDVIEPERRGRRRKPFEDVPTAVEAELKNISKNDPRLRDDDSTPLGITGWDGQGEPNDREKNENGKGKKRSLFNQLFRKKSNDDEEEEKRNDEIPSSPIPIPPSPPPYDPPSYDNDDDEISDITDRVFFPKRPNSFQNSDPGPNPFQNPDPIQEKPSSRGSLDGSGRFSITSFRRNNSIRNTERALEGMNSSSIEPSYAESLPSEDRRKRDIRRALSGRSPKLRPRLANLPEESPISQYMQNDTADMRFPYDYGSSAQLSSNYYGMSQSSSRSFDLPSSHDVETQGVESEPYDSPDITEEVIEEVFVGYDDEDSNEEEDARDDDISHKTKEETKNRKSRRLSLICCIVTFNLLLLLSIGTWLLLEYFIFDENRAPPIDPSDGSPSDLSPIKSDSTIEEKKDELSTILKPNLSDGGKALDDDTSPQADALDWLSKNPLIHTYDEQKLFTRFTLATFYYSTDGDNWTTNHLWLTDLDECLWYTSSFENPCTEQGFSRLVLTDNNLQGSIPQELSLLSNSLVNLDVDGTFTGSIPFNIGDLAQLTSLRLSGRVLSGKIPDSLYTLSNLSALDLGRNVLSGRLSTAIGSLSPSLNAISFMDNHLTGPVPEEVGQLTGLTYFNIDDNYFDFISEDAISRLSKLETLSARNNVLKGNLPFIDGNSLPNLGALFLNNNELTGSIPDSYGSLSTLEGGLDLSSNRLVGRVPESMGQLSMLRHLLLRDNGLSGTIPLSWGKLSILDTLRLDSTNFEGELPDELCDSFDETSSSFYADCWKLDCPCCNFCCDSDTGECFCRFEDSLPILCVAP